MRTYQLKPRGDLRAAACQSAISSQLSLHVRLYRYSALITGWTDGKPKAVRPPDDVPRGTVGDLSNKSARRLVFWLSNAECQWYAMTTLTFQTEPDNPKRVFRRWVREMQKHGFCYNGWCWVMEFQRRGVTHFHVLWSLRECTRDSYYNGHSFELVDRGGKATTLLRGAFDRLVTRSWIYANGNYDSAFLSFQSGGTTELLRTPDAAPRYFAGYCAKKEQKTLPEGKERQGRWWFCSQDTKPKARAEARLTGYPLENPTYIVFDKARLEGHLTSIKPLVELYETK